MAVALLLAGVVAGGAALVAASDEADAGHEAVAAAVDGNDGSRSRPVQRPSPPEPKEAAASPAAPAADAAPPRHLRVPALGIDAPVGDLGLTDDGRLEVPTTAEDVGWWSGGSAPGSPGPTVLAAHVDWKGRAGVFQRLADLAPGDVVTVRDADGTDHEYTVERLEQHAKDAFPTDAVYGPTDDPTLRLITCGGAFDHESGHYLDNLIVFARPGGPG